MSVRSDGATNLRVGLDVTSLLHHRTGVGVFVHEVAEGLAAGGAVDLSVFAVSWRGRDRLAEVVPAGAEVRGRPMPAQLARGLWDRFDHPTARLLAGPVDVVHGPNFVVPPETWFGIRVSELAIRQAEAVPPLAVVLRTNTPVLATRLTV